MSRAASVSVGPTRSKRACRVSEPAPWPAEYSAKELSTLLAARQIIERNLRTGGLLVTSPGDVKGYVGLRLAGFREEHFAVAFLDAACRLIAFEVMFRGTLTQTSVYPREVAIEALKLGAAAVILAHNHPSGAAEPSAADVQLTRTLRTALGLVGILVRDHLIVAGSTVVSFVELGLM